MWTTNCFSLQREAYSCLTIFLGQQARQECDAALTFPITSMNRHSGHPTTTMPHKPLQECHPPSYHTPPLSIPSCWPHCHPFLGYDRILPWWTRGTGGKRIRTGGRGVKRDTILCMWLKFHCWARRHRGCLFSWHNQSQV